jgi:hypothetical protein
MRSEFKLSRCSLFSSCRSVSGVSMCLPRYLGSRAMAIARVLLVAVVS